MTAMQFCRCTHFQFSFISSIDHQAHGLKHFISHNQVRNSEQSRNPSLEARPGREKQRNGEFEGRRVRLENQKAIVEVEVRAPKGEGTIISSSAVLNHPSTPPTPKRM